MHLFRVPVAWSGGNVVGTAVNVLHFDGSNQSAPPVGGVQSAYDFLAQILNIGTAVAVPNSGDIIEDTTGALVGTWTGTGGHQTLGTARGVVAGGVGACVTWKTTTIAGAHRLQGRTFIVPLDSACYDNTGLLNSTAQSVLNGFGSQLRAAGPFAIWHRPTTKGATNGSSGPVTSHRLSSKVAVLHSRRY